MRTRIEHNADQVAAALKAGPGIINRHVDRKMLRGSIEVASLAKVLVAKAYSTLANSIHPENLGPGLHDIVAPQNYARAVEEGTREGGEPPIQSLLDWMQVKGIASDNPLNTAFLIQRKIVREGTSAQPYMGPALEQSQGRLNELMKQGVADALREVAQ